MRAERTSTEALHSMDNTILNINRFEQYGPQYSKGKIEFQKYDAVSI